MNAGVKTNNISTHTPLSDEVVVNRNGSTALQRTAELSAQLAGSGPIAQAIAEAREAAGAAGEGYVVGLTWNALNAIVGTRQGQPGRVPNTDTGTHVDPVTGGDPVPNAGEYAWNESPAGWRRTGNVIDAVAVALLQLLTDPLVEEITGRFRVLDEDGWRVLETDPDKGVGVGGAWLAASLRSGLHLRDEDGWEVLGIDRDNGLSLPSAYLRPGVDALLRVMDVEGFIYFQIGANGRTTHAGGSRDDVASSAPASCVRMWTGAVTPSGFKVACDIENGGLQSVAQIEVSTDPYFTNIAYRGPALIPALTTRGGGRYWRSVNAQVDGLDAGTQYHVRVVADGVPSQPLKVKTAPAAGSAAAFSVVFGSCNLLPADDNARIPAFDAIAAEEDVALFMHLGDIDYSDIGTASIEEYRTRNTRRWRDNISVRAMLTSIPAAYMGDDHDTGPDDNHYDLVVPGATMSALWRCWRQAYRETVPHFPFAHQQLGETDPDKIVPTQVFDLGKARFVLLDTRTQRRYQSGTPTVLGIGSNPPGSWDQLGWLIGTILPAAAADAQAGSINRLFIVTPSGWTGAAYDGWAEHWPAEQTAICDAMAGLPDLPPMTILTGDFHYCAADDGTNTDKSTGGVLGAKLTQLMSSPFLRPNYLTGGGPFAWDGSNGRILTAQAYCRLDVRADGSWLATFKGAPFDPDTGAPTVLGTFDTNDL